jgi:hypothetical protein
VAHGQRSLRRRARHGSAWRNPLPSAPAVGNRGNPCGAGRGSHPSGGRAGGLAGRRREPVRSARPPSADVAPGRWAPAGRHRHRAVGRRARRLQAAARSLLRCRVVAARAVRGRRPRPAAGRARAGRHRPLGARTRGADRRPRMVPRRLPDRLPKRRPAPRRGRRRHRRQGACAHPGWIRAGLASRLRARARLRRLCGPDDRRGCRHPPDALADARLGSAGAAALDGGRAEADRRVGARGPRPRRRWAATRRGPDARRGASRRRSRQSARLRAGGRTIQAGGTQRDRRLSDRPAPATRAAPVRGQRRIRGLDLVSRRSLAARRLARGRPVDLHPLDRGHEARSDLQRRQAVRPRRERRRALPADRGLVLCAAPSRAGRDPGRRRRALLPHSRDPAVAGCGARTRRRPHLCRHGIRSRTRPAQPPHERSSGDRRPLRREGALGRRSAVPRSRPDPRSEQRRREAGILGRELPKRPALDEPLDAAERRQARLALLPVGDLPARARLLLVRRHRAGREQTVTFRVAR